MTRSSALTTTAAAPRSSYYMKRAKHTQILLFTCQHREAAYLSGRNGVTFLSL